MQKNMQQSIEELTAEKHRLMQTSNSKNLLNEELTKQQETINKLKLENTDLSSQLAETKNALNLANYQMKQQ
jgi:hypothetical protein